MPATAISLTNFRAYARKRGTTEWNCNLYRRTANCGGFMPLSIAHLIRKTLSMLNLMKVVITKADWVRG